jgi:dTDP-4-dehydrorhamnose 3,5-epimerase
VSVEIRPYWIDGVYEVLSAPYSDVRGFQTKPYNEEDFTQRGLGARWKQVIHNHSRRANTVRGLYVQRQPYSEGKLAACVRGAMYWVVVDVRRDSPSFGHWAGMRLTPEDGRVLLVAPGFAHGCVSLEDDSALLLLADNTHAPDHGVGIAWNDREIGIEWPLTGPDPLLSDAHATAMSFAAFKRSVGGI